MASAPPALREHPSVRNEPRLGVGFALLFAAILLAGELIGWRKIAVLWVLLFIGTLVVKLFRSIT